MTREELVRRRDAEQIELKGVELVNVDTMDRHRETLANVADDIARSAVAYAVVRDRMQATIASLNRRIKVRDEDAELDIDAKLAARSGAIVQPGGAHVLSVEYRGGTKSS